MMWTAIMLETLLVICCISNVKSMCRTIMTRHCTMHSVRIDDVPHWIELAYSRAAYADSCACSDSFHPCMTVRQPDLCMKLVQVVKTSREGLDVFS